MKEESLGNATNTKILNGYCLNRLIEMWSPIAEKYTNKKRQTDKPMPMEINPYLMVSITGFPQNCTK